MIPRVNCLALVALTLSAACSSSTAPTTSIRGSYVLSTVNGSALPATKNVNGFMMTFSSGTMTVTDSAFQWRVCIPSPSALSACGNGFDQLWAEGTWKATSASSVTFVGNTESPTAVSVSGSQLTFSYGSNGVLTFTFTKQ